MDDLCGFKPYRIWRPYNSDIAKKRLSSHTFQKIGKSAVGDIVLKHQCSHTPQKIGKSAMHSTTKCQTGETTWALHSGNKIFLFPLAYMYIYIYIYANGLFFLYSYSFMYPRCTQTCLCTYIYIYLDCHMRTCEVRPWKLVKQNRQRLLDFGNFNDSILLNMSFPNSKTQFGGNKTETISWFQTQRIHQPSPSRLEAFFFAIPFRNSISHEGEFPVHLKQMLKQ